MWPLLFFISIASTLFFPQSSICQEELDLHLYRLHSLASNPDSRSSSNLGLVKCSIHKDPRFHTEQGPRQTKTGESSGLRRTQQSATHAVDKELHRHSTKGGSDRRSQSAQVAGRERETKILRATLHRSTPPKIHINTETTIFE